PESFDLEQLPDEFQVDRIVVDNENMSADFRDRWSATHGTSLYSSRIGESLKNPDDFREKSDPRRISIGTAGRSSRSGYSASRVHRVSASGRCTADAAGRHRCADR